MYDKGLSGNTEYEKKLILGDFNTGVDDPHIKLFCETYNLANLSN